MSVVARGVLGATPSAAVLKCDFGECSKSVSRNRRSLDSGHVEVIVFLRRAYDHISSEVPKLSPKEAKQVIPTRLKDPRMQSAIQDMTFDDSRCEDTELFAVRSVDEDDENGDGHDDGVSVTDSNDRGGAC